MAAPFRYELQQFSATNFNNSPLRTSTIPDNEKQYPGADAEHPTAPGITGKRVKTLARRASAATTFFPLAVHRRRSLA
jgi:hypothetical protein